MTVNIPEEELLLRMRRWLLLGYQFSRDYEDPLCKAREEHMQIDLRALTGPVPAHILDMIPADEHILFDGFEGVVESSASSHA